MATNKLSPVDIIKPIPIGGSWTDAPKSRAWQNPPKLVKTDEIAQKYIDKLSSPETINSALDVVETKVPLASMAEALMLSGVAVGVHTIDAGLLVMPVIIEMLKTIAEIHKVEYTIFPADPEDTQIPARVINSAIKKAMATKEITPEETTKPVVELSGLMTRKPTTMENVNGI
jgi:2-phospho-L-lactate transferase/gluconeogenesis factor (CofD/UPF0052 family)